MKRISRDSWLGKVRTLNGGVSVGITLPPDICRALDFSDSDNGVLLVIDRETNMVILTKAPYDDETARRQNTAWRNGGRKFAR